jgi:hypothetical protein
MSRTANQPAMSSAKPKTSFSQYFNPRVLIFTAVIGVILGYPLYIFIDDKLSGGVKDVGGGFTLVDLKHLSTFDFDQRYGKLEDVPRQWRELEGKKVVLVGEIAPTTFATRGLNEFDLVYSVSKCCFTGAPQVQHFINARLPAGQKMEYVSGPVKVQGILHVNVVREQDRVSSVYQLDVQGIEVVN